MPAKPVTVVVRVPDEVYDDVRRWAQVKGITPGDLLKLAWDEWVSNHRAEILADLDKLRAEIEATGA